MAVVEGTTRQCGDAVGTTTHDLYRQYGKQIYAYCYHRLRSREEAEDAVQTTFMNAFRALQRGAKTQYEQAWLFKIAQNVCIARSSSSARRLRLEAPNDFELLQEIVPAHAVEEPLELMGVEDALEQMPENQRRAILLREWQGLSYREIGEELQLSQAAVEMLIFRARRSLAGALEQPVEKKPRRVGRKVGSLGSVLGALKTLLGGGAAIKAAAVAAAAIAVVGESAQHTIVRSSVGRIPSARTQSARTHAAGGVRVTRAAATVLLARVAPTARTTSRPASNGRSPRPVATAFATKSVHTATATRVQVRPDEDAHAAAVTTTVPAPAPQPPAPAAPASPAPASPAPAGPAPVSAAPTTTDADPIGGNGDHGRKGKPKDDPQPVASTIEPVATTSTTTTTTTTTTITAAPVPTDPQPSHGNDGDHGHHGWGKDGKGKDDPQPAAVVVPPPVVTVPAATTTTPTTTTVSTPPAPQPQPQADSQHGNGNGKQHRP